MRVLILAAIAALTTAVLASPADAKRHKAVQSEEFESSQTDSKPNSHRSGSMVKNFWDEDNASSEASERPSRRTRRHRDNDDGESSGGHESAGGAGPRPSAWCGWYMRTRHGGGPEYNLAANWAHRGSPSSPQVGAIVVWSHHVGEIVGQTSSGQWIVLSGNDSHRVQERARSISGATIRML